MAAQHSKPRESVDRFKIVRDWFDVLAKTVIAIVGVVFALYADDYRQKTSVVTLLSQREAAETKLKSDMMQYLIGPFVGNTGGAKELDPKRARLLLDLLALNFHTHLELKPLMLRVDAQLKDLPDDRRALRSTARRVVDRQIAMLRAAASEARSSARAGEADLYFQSVQTFEGDPNVTLRAPPAGTLEQPAQGDQINAAWNPAYFTRDVGQSVCSVAPDRSYAVRIRVDEFDASEGSAAVKWSVGKASACETADGKPGSGDGWRDLSASGFTLTPYDFPLTDNAQLDGRERFALNLYFIEDKESYVTLLIKLVWFPPGYVTERERPMNYNEVNRTLGLD